MKDKKNTSKEQQIIDQNVSNLQKEQDERKRREEYRNFHQCFNVVIPRHLHIPEHVLAKHHETKELLPSPVVHKPRVAAHHHGMETSHPVRQALRDGVPVPLRS